MSNDDFAKVIDQNIPSLDKLQDEEQDEDEDEYGQEISCKRINIEDREYHEVRS